MSEKKYNISAEKEVSALEIREGSARAFIDPKTVNISGILKAPFQFLKDKLSGSDVDKMGNEVSLILTDEKIYHPKRSHILVDRSEGTLILVLNEKDKFGDSVSGRLSLDENFLEFYINKEKQFELDELIRLIKKNKFFFADPGAHGTFLMSLTNFNARVNTSIKKHRDNNGSKSDAMEMVVNEGKAAPKFKLHIPIYKGYPKVTIEIELGISVTDARCRFFMESIDAFEMIEMEKEKHINEQLDAIKEIFPCSVVEV